MLRSHVNLLGTKRKKIGFENLHLVTYSDWYAITFHVKILLISFLLPINFSRVPINYLRLKWEENPLKKGKKTKKIRTDPA